MKKLIMAWSVLVINTFAGVVSDSDLGYSITLPTNWIQLKTKPTQHYFRDSTKQYKSQISILKYAIDNASYPSPNNWSEAQFIAYKLSVESSVFPFGTVMYFDSSSTAKIGTLWAPEAFSVLYPGNGDPTYCELIRYVANGDYGYEIYAIGDSTDMASQVDFYAGIIATTQLSTPTTAISPSRNSAQVSEPALTPIEKFDFLGREIRIVRRQQIVMSKPAGVEQKSGQ